MGMKFVGARIRRGEDAALLCGAGCFTDDLRLDGTLVATFVRSEFAHARIAGIDVAAARAMPGVVGIWTAADLPELRSFANGIRSGKEAVLNALTLPRSSGRVEGTVNRKITTGQAPDVRPSGFPLLRRRIVLYPP